MSAAPGSNLSTRAGLGALASIALATAMGVNIAPYLMGVAIPAIIVGALSLMVGVEEIARPAFKLAVGLIVLALAAPALAGVLMALLTSPYVEGALCVLLALAILVGLLGLAAKSATVHLPEPRKRHRAQVRERVALVRPNTEPVLAAPREAEIDDEVAHLEGDR